MKLLPTINTRYMYFVILLLLLVSCQTLRQLPQGEDYAAWSVVNRDGSWTRAAERAVYATALAEQTPADIDHFCPRYTDLDESNKVKFWVGLLSAIAKFESGHNPATLYTEKFTDNRGIPVVSRGLLQLSIESASQPRYGCDLTTVKSLHDPSINLACGARILSTWVRSDSVVTSTGEFHRGGARYWSVLRASGTGLDRISAITRGFEFCET